jgi:hypothetical protein
MGIVLRSLRAFLSFAALTSFAHAQDSQETICSNAWIIYCDNFDARTPGTGDFARATDKNQGWEGGYRWSIEAGAGVRGSNALRVDCAAHGPGQPSDPGDPANGCGGYVVATYSVPASVRTIWLRWYTKWSSTWKTSPAAEKHIIVQYGNGPQNQGIHMAWSTSGTQPTYAYISAVDQVYPPNGSSWSRQLNRWYCVEARVALSTSSTSTDGAIELWYDGQRIMNYPNIRTNRFDNLRHYQTLWSAYYNCVSVTCTDTADTHPAMFRLHDNIVIGTQQIGCLGSAGS